MLDTRVRIERAQRGEHGVVGDLAGETHASRARCGAPARSSEPCANATACRKCASRPLRPSRIEERLDAFAGAAQRQRLRPRERAQEDLQPAVAADVVERRPGCARRRAERGRSASRAYARPSSAGRWCPKSASPIRWRSAARAARASGASGRRQATCDRDVDLGGGVVAVIDQRVRLGRARRARRGRRMSAPGGQSTMRRARPSSSISAAAALAMSPTASSDRAPFEARPMPRRGSSRRRNRSSATAPSRASRSRRPRPAPRRHQPSPGSAVQTRASS